MLRLSIFESILFVEEYLYTIYDTNNLHQDNDETDSKIHKKIHFYDDRILINCNLERCIDGISSICFIYQLVDYYLIRKYLLLVILSSSS